MFCIENRDVPEQANNDKARAHVRRVLILEQKENSGSCYGHGDPARPEQKSRLDLFTERQAHGPDQHHGDDEDGGVCDDSDARVGNEDDALVETLDVRRVPADFLVPIGFDRQTYEGFDDLQGYIEDYEDAYEEVDSL